MHKCSLVPRPSASRARIAYVTFEPLSDSWQGFKGHICDARATGRWPGNEASTNAQIDNRHEVHMRLSIEIRHYTEYQHIISGYSCNVFHTNSLTSSSVANVHMLLSSVKMLTPTAESASKSCLVSAG